MKSGRGPCVPELKKRLIPPCSCDVCLCPSYTGHIRHPSCFPLEMGFVCHCSENSQEEKDLLEVCNRKPTSEDPLGTFLSGGT